MHSGKTMSVESVSCGLEVQKRSEVIKIALTGNPNSGKTSLLTA